MELIFLIFGYIGSFLLCSSFIPQIYHVFSKKNTEALSTKFIILQFLTCFFLSAYSIGFLYKNDFSGIPLLAANIFIIICLIFLSIAKYKYK
jgi:uncharacterized protein with PQ loop repeat